jgi:4'-phosphopantetheinyl transferase
MRRMTEGKGGEGGVWRKPPAEALPMAGEPGDGTVDVWRVELAEVGDEWGELLSAGERERARGILNVEKGRLWARGRGVLRGLLGSYLARNPRELGFAVGVRGKPALVEARLRFNLSHSGGVMLVAVSTEREVGVDVEVERRPAMDGRLLVGVAQRGLGEEVGRRLKELGKESREGELLRAWTAHEAALKCTGTGIGDRGANDSLGRRGTWTATLELGRGAFGALAAEGAQEAELRCWEWRPRASVT